MNYKIIIIGISIVAALLLLYLEIRTIKQNTNHGLLESRTKKLFDKYSSFLQNDLKSTMNKHIEKIKEIGADNLNQLKKIHILNYQTITKSSNHFTETMDSEKHSNINYLSDMIGQHSIEKAKKQDKQHADYYMSENTSISEFDIAQNKQTDQTSKIESIDKICNDDTISKDSKTSKVDNEVIYIEKHGSLSSCPVKSNKNNYHEVIIDIIDMSAPLFKSSSPTVTEPKVVEITNNIANIVMYDTTTSENSDDTKNVRKTNNKTFIEDCDVNVLNKVGTVLDKISNILSDDNQKTDMTPKKSDTDKCNINDSKIGNNTDSNSKGSIHNSNIPNIIVDNENSNSHTSENTDTSNSTSTNTGTKSNNGTNSYNNSKISKDCSNNDSKNSSEKMNGQKKELGPIAKYSITELRNIAKQNGIRISTINGEDNGKKIGRLYKKEELYKMINETYISS